MRHPTAGSVPFEVALDRIRGMIPRPDLHVEEVPAPQRLAPQALALTAELWDHQGEEVGSGRFVLLHDPDGTDEWEGTFRAVVFVRAPLEAELATDLLQADVGWSWLMDALDGASAPARQLGGTVTRTFSASFGTMDERPASGAIEIRASWTPQPGDQPEDSMERHVTAWLALLEMACGMIPMPQEVTRVDTPRRRSRV